MTNQTETVGRAKRPTLRDVSALASVDPSIASRVLGGELNRVSSETRERIFAAADELGWRPHPAARSLRMGTTTALALIVPSIQNPAYGSMIRGAQHAAMSNDHVLVVADTAGSGGRDADELRRISSHVDGVIIASAKTREADKADILSTLAPTVLLNRRGLAGLPAVLGPDEEGCRLAVDHLVGLGHRRIAFLGGPRSVDTVVRRVAAFHASLADHGLTAHAVTYAVLEIEPAALAARELLDRPEAERPTAIFAAALSAALGVVLACRDLGVTIPDNLSLVGLDDAQIAEFLTPPLTAIRMPHEQMGALAVESVLALMRGTALPPTIAVGQPAELMVRGTTSRLVESR